MNDFHKFLLKHRQYCEKCSIMTLTPATHVLRENGHDVAVCDYHFGVETPATVEQSTQRDRQPIMKRNYGFWIKERHNPQTGIYYVACGRISNTAAKKHHSSLYGENIMHRFDSEKTYKARIAELLAKGEKFV